MPLGYYIVVRLARMLPFEPNVTLRLPSIVGYLLTLAACFRFVQRKSSSEAASLAALLITVTPLRVYAVEARPYALVVGLIAVAVVAWGSVRRSAVSTFVLAFALTAAVAIHHLTVLVLGIFAVAELTVTLNSRGIRWPVWAGLAAAALPFVLQLPLLLQYRAQFGSGFWTIPSITQVWSTYPEYLGMPNPWALMLLVALLINIMRAGGLLSVPERVLLGGLVCYPAILVVMSVIGKVGFVPRYAGGAFDWYTQYALENGVSLQLVSPAGAGALYIATP